MVIDFLFLGGPADGEIIAVDGNQQYYRHKDSDTVYSYHRIHNASFFAPESMNWDDIIALLVSHYRTKNDI